MVYMCQGLTKLYFSQPILVTNFIRPFELHCWLSAQLVGGEAYNLTIAHHDEIAVVLACALYEAALRKKNACIYTFL